MILKTLTLTGILLLLIASCKEEEKQQENSFRTIVTDTPVNHRIRNELDFSRRMSDRLNLARIDKGVDSFELRIWVTSMIIPADLVVLKFLGNKWVAYKYWFYNHDGNGIDSMNVYKIPTLKGIDNFVSYAKSKEVLELPSQDAIPKFEDNIGDGQTITIEIATSTFYKALQYHSRNTIQKSRTMPGL
jgi:hypothetical protein